MAGLLEKFATCRVRRFFLFRNHPHGEIQNGLSEAMSVLSDEHYFLVLKERDNRRIRRTLDSVKTLD